MSHLPERKEKDCLNCGAVIYGRFCQVCGQENVIPRESFWGIITHFFQDITHFDGRFFSTIRYLLFRPGYLTAEFVLGRRASYVHPIRLYVFTSAFFFLLFFSFILNTSVDDKLSGLSWGEKLKKREVFYAELDSMRVNTRDSSVKQAIVRSQLKVRQELDTLKVKAVQEAERLRAAKETRRQELEKAGEKKGGGMVVGSETRQNQGIIKIGDGGFGYTSVEAYRMVQAELPDSLRDKGMSRIVGERLVNLVEKETRDGSGFRAAFTEKFIHYFPQMMFVSLPLFALTLQLLYFRRKVFYSEHAIFTIHYYCASFLILLVVYLFQALGRATGWDLFNWLMGITIFVQFIYLYRAMRFFYRQGRGKTILKFILLNFAFMVMSVLLILGYLIWTASKI